MAKKPQLTSHKSRFEILEDRRLLTTFNVTDPMTQEGSSTPVVIDGKDYYYGGEDAFGDNATTLYSTTAFTTGFHTASGYENNNNGTGPVTAYLPYTYSGGTAAVWDYGAYDSGAAASNAGEYDPVTMMNEFPGTPADFAYAAQVIPSTFDTYGANGSSSGSASDGAGAINGIAGWLNSNNSNVEYVYGNGGLKASALPGSLTGNGEGEAVPDVLSAGGEDTIVDTPVGTLELLPDFGPQVERFTAPTTGSYSISSTFTDPYFDPFNGTGGGNGDESWTWDDGQPTYEIIQNSYSNGVTPYSTVAGSATLDNGSGDDLANSQVLASAGPQDILAVNQAHTGSGYDDPESGPVGNSVYTDLPTPGNSISGSTAAGSALQVQYGTGTQNSHSGNGGTWTLYNAGPIAGGSGPGSNTNQKSGTDWTNDEYDLSWTVNKTVALKAGDTIDLVTWGGPDWYDPEGINVAPTYLAASISTSSITPAPGLAPSGTSNTFTLGGSAVAVDSGLTVSSSETDLTSAQLTIGTGFQSGDMLNYTNTTFGGQNVISGSYDSATGVLSLTGTATPTQYQTALDSVTFSTTSATTGDRTISEALGEVPTSPAATETVHVVMASSFTPPSVSASGSTGQTFTRGGSNVAVDSGITVTAGSDSSITGATETLTNAQTGDTLHFTNQNGITGTYSAGVLTLGGTATVANYQTALESVTFSTTSTVKGTRTVDVAADDTTGSPSTGSTAVDSVVVHINAPVVTASGSTGQTFTLGGSNVTVDSGITATSADASLTGATETIVGAQTGDILHFTTQNGITGSYTGGVLTLTGTATPAFYQTALESVTFSTTSTTKGTRTIDVVASDSNANTTTSNTAVDSVVVAINAPVLTAGHSGINYTAGQSAKVLDSGIAVASADASLTGASVTISAGTLQSGDTLNFTNQNGITGSYSAGVLTLTGTSTVANYQTALQSISFVNTTSTSTTNRSISIVATD
ncbi:MAG TPA: hypothetical protein VHY91_07105, partial [Pirellulales bacterium]|nr:hypothetical protein [Pirellulales bacterium]